MRPARFFVRFVEPALGVALSLAVARPAAAGPPFDSVHGGAGERTRAQHHYEQGAADYRAGRYSRAIAHFLAADALAPSPAHSFNVARAYEKLGELDQALRHYRDYLRREPTAERALEAKAAVRALERSLARRGVQQLTVLSEPSAELSIDGLRLGPTPWTGELTPGSHRLVLTRDGYAVESRDFDLPAQRAIDVVIRLEALPASNAPVAKTPRSAALRPASRSVESEDASDEAAENASFRPWSFILIGVGASGLAAAGVLELSRRRAGEQAREADSQLDRAEHLETMNEHRTAARIALGVGAGFAALGGALVAADALRSDAPTQVSFGCGATGCFGGLRSTLP